MLIDIVFIVSHYSYMLSYHWQEKLKREGKDPFQEHLLAKRQKDDVDQVGTIIVLFGNILMYTL